MVGEELWRPAALAAATLVSEDLACLSAGLLIRAHEMNAVSAVGGCLAGIFLGDLGLWGAGRLFGRRLLAWGPVARRLPPGAIEKAGRRLDDSLPGAVLASRFLPGARLPMFLAAGMLGRRPGRFAWWTFIAAAVWTPLLVMASALAGPPFAAFFRDLFGSGRWLPGAVAAAVALLLSWRVVAAASSRRGRARLAAAVSRLWRWEFWPSWVLYPPVIVWIGLLCLRYRGFTTITAANPAIPDGGFVGESKHRILAALPASRTLPWALVPAGGIVDRMAALRRGMREAGLSFPIILKPDVGQRGDGVRLARGEDEAREYLAGSREAVIAQKFHPGPHEAGIFYYRIPGERRGRIFSITDKIFPVVVGDGRSSLDELIWSHPRYRMQAGTFRRRLAGRLDSIPARGRRVPLCLAGNHAQGTMFRDGGHLATPELERAVDEAARGFDGFHFGRFDVRYADVAAFKAGEDLAIVELNGVTSESTNIYDPSRTLPAAWRILFAQWALLFRIGHLNRVRGFEPTPMRELALRVIRYYRTRPAPALAD